MIRETFGGFIDGKIIFGGSSCKTGANLGFVTRERKVVIKYRLSRIEF